MISIVLISVSKISLILLTVILLILYLYLKKKYEYWNLKNVPCAKPLFPFGSLAGIVKGNAMCDVFKKIYDQSKHQRYYGMWLFLKPALMINDPDLIKRILVENFSHFHGNGSSLGSGNDVLFTDSLFSLEGSRWKSLRSKITPIFSSGKLKAVFPLIVKCGRDLQEVLEEPAKMNDDIDVKEFSDRFIIDAISSTAFGIEINYIKNADNAIAKMMNRVFQPGYVNTYRYFCAVFIPSVAKTLKIPLNSKEVQNFFIKMFRDLVDFREKNNFSRNDVMQLLIELLKKGYLDHVNPIKDETNVTKQKFTFENLVTQAVGFLIGGYKTTSLTIQFALFEMAVNREIQAKLRKEINTVLARHNGKITYEAVSEMNYLERVVKETLRKHPPGGAILRVCTNEFKDPCSDLIFDKNITAFIPVAGLHHDERYYPNPQKFDPDRFTEENKAARPNYTFLPFGDGPRQCIGQRFSQLKIKVMLISILSKFQLDISEKYPHTSIELDPKYLLSSPKNRIVLKISLAGQ